MRYVTVAVCLVGLAFAVQGAWADDKAMKPKAAKKIEFELKDTEGKTFKSSDFKDKYIVLEWIEPTCPVCKRHAREKSLNHLVKKYKKNKDVVILGVCTSRKTDTAGMKAFMEKHKLDYRVLMDTTGKVGRMVDAKKTPHMYVLKNGEILYHGALDDDPRGRKSEKERVNYVSKALDEAIAGKKISTKYTKPYG